MKFTASQIAQFLQGEVVGDPEVEVSDLSKIEEGVPGTLTFLSNPKYTHYIYTTKADVVLVDKDFVAEHPISATLIRVESAYQSLSKLLQLVDSLKVKKQGIDKSAILSDDCKLGTDCYVGAYAVIGNGVCVGNNVKIYPHVFIDDNVTIGDNSVIYAHATIYDSCVIGNRCVIQAGAVIGADGFGFAPDEQGHYHKIPQIGNVVLEDDVEVGANATIDRATMGSTIIRRGVKIDNLVQIAHNVEVDEDTAMAAQTGVAGSTKIGKRCIFAGQVGVAGHLHIADGSIFGAQTGVTGNIKQPDGLWQGYPAMPVPTFRRMTVVQKQLPDLQKKVYELEKRIQELEK